MSDNDEQDKERLIELIGENPRMAHELLFEHRHPNKTPDFHGDIIDVWHDHTKARVSIQAFRGGAKSTVGCEEATIIMALLGVFKNGLIIGERYDRAVERLDAIKYEIENNEAIHEIFGDCKGKIWKEGKIELANGTVIQAVGRGQSMRGSKHRDQRPDYCVGDDIEDMDSVRTEEAKKATLAWFMSVVMPALDKNNHLIRIVGTPLETNSLMETLVDDSGWDGLRFPIESVNAEGERVPTWPDRFPLEDIDKIKESFERMGLLLEYGREYMCEARSGETRIFTQDMVKVEPKIKKWEAVYAMFDPARTVNKDKSDHTGMAVWSWVGHELRIWEASGHFWMPDELVKDMFRVNETYNPVVIGVEKTGLNEWVMQPIRQEISKSGVLLPIRAMDAPRDRSKKKFIEGLQPFFAAGEVVMNQQCPDLVSQLLNHPVGRDDVPNALAYALKMRPGLPVYEDFSNEHVVAEYMPTKNKYALAVNYEMGVLTGVISQMGRNGIVVVDNVVLEGDPQQRVSDLLEYSYYVAGEARNLNIFVHPAHFERYSTSGLIGALRNAKADPKKSGDILKGRTYLVDKLRERRNGRTTFKVSEDAKYVLNAFVGGYAFEYRPGARGMMERANEGFYRTLMEGFECSLALSQGVMVDEDENLNYSIDRKTGKRYLSTRPNRG
jgi:hypothetical protein